MGRQQRGKGSSEETGEKGGRRKSIVPDGKKRRKGAAAAEMARRAEEEAGKGHNDWQGDLGRAVESAQITLAPDEPSPSPGPSSPPDPSSRPASSEPPESRRGRKERAPQPVTTRAGTPQYDAFFGLYATLVRSSKCPSLVRALQGKAWGNYFVPLGFIPGPAIILCFRKDGWVKMVDVTPDVREWLANEARKAEEAGKAEEAERLKIPSSWMEVEKLPSKVLHSLSEWQTIIEDLGYELSPWNFGLAKRILEGNPPSQSLSMVMPRFRYRSGDPERPLGIVLVPTEDGQGMKLERVHNPQGISDVPDEGVVLTIEELKDGRGPVQKLLRTSAGMESNFLGRFTRTGERLSQPRYGRRALAR